MRWAKLLLRRPFSQRRARSLPLLLVSLLLLCLWQGCVVSDATHATVQGRFQHNVAGARHQWRFVYFMRHLGLYPVTPTIHPWDDSPAGAEKMMREHPEWLRTEFNFAVRTGDLGQIWLFMPDTWWHGTLGIPRMSPANATAFVCALAALLLSFWWVRQPVLGCVMIALLGSDPFQVFEVYGRQNVFSWFITTAILVLALHLPLLGPWPRSRRYRYAVPIITGLLLATARTIRPEPVVLMVSALGAYLTLSGTRWRTRLLLSALALSTLSATSWAWSRYYQHKVAEATRRVEQAGGEPFRGPSYLLDHQTWTALWEGLGDFDTTHGHYWSDWMAAACARPILRQRFGVELPEQSPTDKYSTGQYWDDGQRYAKIPTDNLPHYQEVLRQSVLHDITHDPLWFAGILAKRAWRILDETTPLQILLGQWALPVPMHGLAALALLALLWWAKARWQTKLLLFFAPLSLLPLLVFSGLGATYYGLYHLAAAALALTIVVRLISNAALTAKSR